MSEYLHDKFRKHATKQGFEIPKRWHCTTGFLPYCWSSRLNTRSVRKVNAFCKQASNVLSGTRNFKTFDQHMAIMFDWSSQSRAPFASERRISKSRGLSTSISFAPLRPPSYFCSRPIFSRGQSAENLVLRSLLHGNACYAGYLSWYNNIAVWTKKDAVVGCY